MRPEPPGTTPKGKHCQRCEVALRREFDALDRNQRLTQGLERWRELHPEDGPVIDTYARWP